MTDQYQWWRDALAGKNGPIHADAPQSGYYRMRRGKDGPYVPVAIWSVNGAMICRVGPDTDDPEAIWTFVAGNPVTKEAAKHAFEHGTWPGDVAIGHNSRDMSLADEIKDARATALAWLKSSGIKDKTTMDMAANYRSRLMELSKKADVERDSKVRPHLDAQRDINAEYKPLVEAAKGAADMIRAELSTYMAAEEEKAQAAAREAARIENERRAAEYKRQQEEAAKAAALASVHEPLPAPVEAPVFVAPTEVKLQAGGQRGKKASLREVTKYGLSDYTTALAHAQNHPDVIAAVEKVCFAQARAGATVPGVTSYIEKVAV